MFVCEIFQLCHGLFLKRLFFYVLSPKTKETVCGREWFVFNEQYQKENTQCKNHK